MTSVVNSLAILGLGSLLPVQSSLLTTSAIIGARYQPEKTRKTSAPVTIAINAAAEECATISGSASSPPRTVSFTGTRRVLAPSYCLSKTRRQRRPHNPGDGSDPDDDCGGSGGSDDGRNNFGGGGGDDSEGWEDEDGRGAQLMDTLCLWQALCLFSLLQALHYVATGSRPRGQPHVSALASLTYSLYNNRRAAPHFVMDGV